MGKSKNRRKNPRKTKKHVRQTHRGKSIERSSGKIKSVMAGLTAQIADFPVGPCFASDNWKHEEGALASVVISRVLPNKKLVSVVFLVDLGCLGVKNIVAYKSTKGELETYLHNRQLIHEPVAPETAVKIVRTGVDFAEHCGFEPHADYKIASLILGDIDPEESDEDVGTGRDGKPFFVAGPYDDSDAIMSHLLERFGPDGFHYMMPMGS